MIFNMTLIQRTPPAIEPVSIADAKAHLRLETNADDLVVAALIVAARQQIETSLQVCLIARTFALFLDAWPEPNVPVTVPVAPVVDLIAVRSFAPDDISTTLELANFEFDPGPPARIARRGGIGTFGRLRRMNAIEFTFAAGFGPSQSDIPQSIRQAVLHRVTQLYEHRGSSTEGVPPLPVDPLIAPWRRPRLV